MGATATATSAVCPPFFIHCPINGGLSPRTRRARYTFISTPPCFAISLSPFTLRSLNSYPRDRFFNRFVSRCNLPNSPEPGTSDEVAVFLEVDGVLIDAYLSGNRQAFNVGATEAAKDSAFHFSGCISPDFPVLLMFVSISKTWVGLCKVDRACVFRPLQLIESTIGRKGDGNEERMLAIYFDRIGWPTSLPTNEKGTFMKSVLLEKEKALADIFLSKDTPLRPGVENFIDNACEDGICVVILTATSSIGEETARGIVEKLGDGRNSKLKVIGKKEVESSFYGQLVHGLEKSAGLDEELANEANKAAAAEKKRIAKEVASMLKLHVNINTSTAESVRDIVGALRAGAEIADVPICNCVLVAGSQRAVIAAEIIGMPCIFVRSRLTSRAEFPSAVSVVDGFGNVGLTVSKLRSKLSTSSGA